MKSIAATVDISLRPEDVFWYVTDASRFPEWQGNVVSAHWEGNTPVRVGSLAAVTRRVGPRTLSTTEEITELSPPNILEGARGRRPDYGNRQRHDRATR